MPNQAYFDKIASLKKMVSDAAKCLPAEANIVFDGEDEDYGIHVTINGFFFTIGSEECEEKCKTLVGTRTRTYEGWHAEVADDEGENITDEDLSEFTTIGELICECYCWTLRHIYNNKAHDQAIYSDWVMDKELH